MQRSARGSVFVTLAHDLQLLMLGRIEAPFSASRGYQALRPLHPPNLPQFQSVLFPVATRAEDHFKIKLIDSFKLSPSSYFLALIYLTVINERFTTYEVNINQI